MISICDDGDDRFRVFFDAPTGKRPCNCVRGPRSLANEYGKHIGYLVACHGNPATIPVEQSNGRWH